MNVENLNYDCAINIEEATKSSFLKAGIYKFKINKIPEKSISKKGANMITLELECSNDGGSGTVRDFLVLMTSMQWRLLQFFTAVGQYNPNEKHGTTWAPNWNKIMGSSGTVELEMQKYINKNGEEAEIAKVKNYLPPHKTEEIEEKFDF